VTDKLCKLQLRCLCFGSCSCLLYSYFLFAIAASEVVSRKTAVANFSNRWTDSAHISGFSMHWLIN